MFAQTLVEMMWCMHVSQGDIACTVLTGAGHQPSAMILCSLWANEWFPRTGSFVSNLDLPVLKPGTHFLKKSFKRNLGTRSQPKSILINPGIPVIFCQLGFPTKTSRKVRPIASRHCSMGAGPKAWPLERLWLLQASLSIYQSPKKGPPHQSLSTHSNQ